MNSEKKVSIVVLIPAGHLSLEIMAAAHHLAVKHSLGVHLSLLQNLRLTSVPVGVVDEIKAELTALGATFKGPGQFPLPRICIGMNHCNLGIVDTEALSQKILEKFATRAKTKAKFKIAISGCAMCCSNVKTTDIGIMATRDGYQIFAGGKGGPIPKLGRRIEKKVTEERVLEVISTLVEFHDRKTEKKKRMYKLLEDTEFPFTEV